MSRAPRPGRVSEPTEDVEAARAKLASECQGYMNEPQRTLYSFHAFLTAGGVTYHGTLPLFKRPSDLALFFVTNMVVISTTLFLLYWLSLGQCVPTQSNLTANQDWITRTQAAVDTLQKWYNPKTGLWETTNWWNAANILTMLGNYALLNPAFKPQFEEIAQTTHTKAPGLQGGYLKTRTPNSMDTYIYPNIPPGLQLPPAASAKDGFLNWYYDDEGWWALAWLKAYDVTNETLYLKEAITIFDDMTKGYNATCGGIWWNKGHDANVAIANELFLAVTAQLVNRVPSSQKQTYVFWLQRHWTWFRRAGFINSHGNINDGLDLKTCRNNNGTIWSYNQGVILGALVEANTTGLCGPSSVICQYYIDLISSSAFEKLQDKNAVIHDPCEPNCGNDGPQFKGIFMRNIMAARRFMDQAMAAHGWSTPEIVQNAASIWANDRNEIDKLGLVWSGPYQEATAATQSSALDALVAAIDVEIHAANSSADAPGTATA